MGDLSSMGATRTISSNYQLSPFRSDMQRQLIDHFDNHSVGTVGTYEVFWHASLIPLLDNDIPFAMYPQTQDCSPVTRLTKHRTSQHIKFSSVCFAIFINCNY